MHLYVIRHAQSTMNIKQGGGANCELSPVGYWQAEQIPSFFSDIPVKAIYCSPLRRTILTALPLAQAHQLPIILVPEMSEMFLEEWTDYRDYDWQSCSEIESVYPGVKFIDTHDKSKQWWPVWPEDKRIVGARVQRFYDASLAPEVGSDDHIVVFGHGQTTADLKRSANPGDKIPVYNAGVVEFVMNSEGKCLSAKVHTDHLGPHVSD